MPIFTRALGCGIITLILGEREPMLRETRGLAPGLRALRAGLGSPWIDRRDSKPTPRGAESGFLGLSAREGQM